MFTRVLKTIAGVFVCAGAIPAAAELEPLHRGLGGTLGASYEWTTLADEGMGLQQRNLSAEALEALLGYRWNDFWLAGVDFDYRFQHQQTPLRYAGGTNLSGFGFTVGPAISYRPREHWAVQAALDLAGRYDFKYQTSTALDDHLRSVVGLRVKVHYFFARSWSVDGSVGTQTWDTFHVGGVNRNEKAEQTMVGAGLTYHFGLGGGDTAEPEPTPTPPVPAIVNPSPTPDSGLVADQSASEPSSTVPADDADPERAVAWFESDSAEPTARSKARLADLAKRLKARPEAHVELDGYADNTGGDALNDKLSRARADHVRRALIAYGVKAARVDAVGHGSANPVADNATEEGRAKNRRVEWSWRDE